MKSSYRQYVWGGVCAYTVYNNNYSQYNIAMYMYNIVIVWASDVCVVS